MTKTVASPTLDHIVIDLIAGRPIAPSSFDHGDAPVDRSLIVAASIVRAELGIVRGLCGDSGQHLRLVAGMFDLAVSYEVCDADAVGVIGMLVEAVGSGYEGGVATAIATAMHNFDTPELRAAAAAMVAAATSYLADLSGLDATVVLAEVSAALPDPVTLAGRGRCRTHRAVA